MHRSWGEFTRDPVQVYQNLCQAFEGLKFDAEAAFFITDKDTDEIERELKQAKKRKAKKDGLLLDCKQGFLSVLVWTCAIYFEKLLHFCTGFGC